jgi:hypothetical protein
MEATINNGIEYTYNQVELRKVINNTIDNIKNITIKEFVQNYKRDKYV